MNMNRTSRALEVKLSDLSSTRDEELSFSPQLERPTELEQDEYSEVAQSYSSESLRSLAM